MTTWVLSYLLVGFVLHFIATSADIRPNDRLGWFWELMAVLLWAIVVPVAIYQHVRKGRADAPK